MDKLLEKFKGKRLVKEEHGFPKGHNVPPWPQELKKGLAWIGLRVSLMDKFCPIATWLEKTGSVAQNNH